MGNLKPLSDPNLENGDLVIGHRPTALKSYELFDGYFRHYYVPAPLKDYLSTENQSSLIRYSTHDVPITWKYNDGMFEVYSLDDRYWYQSVSSLLPRLVLHLVKTFLLNLISTVYVGGLFLYAFVIGLFIQGGVLAFCSALLTSLHYYLWVNGMSGPFLNVLGLGFASFTLYKYARVLFSKDFWSVLGIWSDEYVVPWREPDEDKHTRYSLSEMLTIDSYTNAPTVYKIPDTGDKLKLPPERYSLKVFLEGLLRNQSFLNSYDHLRWKVFIGRVYELYYRYGKEDVWNYFVDWVSNETGYSRRYVEDKLLQQGKIAFDVVDEKLEVAK